MSLVSHASASLISDGIADNLGEDVAVIVHDIIGSHIGDLLADHMSDPEAGLISNTFIFEQSSELHVRSTCFSLLFLNSMK